jgi:hypothetical protein
VDLYKGEPDRGEGVAHRYAGMGKGTGVHDQKVGAVQFRALDPVDQSAFVVALKKYDFGIASACNFRQFGLYVGQAAGPVNGWLTRAQEIQIRSIEDQHPTGH